METFLLFPLGVVQQCFESAFEKKFHPARSDLGLHVYLFWEKNSAYMVIGDKYFQILLTILCFKALFVQKHVFFKLWIHEFIEMIAFKCIFGVWISKMKNKFTYMIIRFLEKILPTRLLEPTCLSISEKSSHLHWY